jgi:hydroxyethylthiazole kinase
LKPAIAALFEKILARSPRIHCLTNTVADTFTANGLLAVGAVPSMTREVAEVGELVAGCDGLLVNLGTVGNGGRDGAEQAAMVARASGVPWVLDPVFVDRSPTRAAVATRLIAQKPAVVRCNAAEQRALGPMSAELVLAVTGPTDMIRLGDRVQTIAAGDPMMARTTATGCMASALVTAAVAVWPDPFEATVLSLAGFGQAGAVAAQRAQGPGTFPAALLDCLARLSAL